MSSDTSICRATPHPSVLFTDASFAWPDGSLVLDHVTTAFGAGRTGLIGDNGSGKTTLLRLIVGELTPTSGVVTTTGEVGYLPQHLTLATQATVADLLRVQERLDALAAIEAGRVDQELFDTIGDGWDVEAHARAALDALGLPQVELTRGVRTLSGGEVMLTALAGLRLAGAPIVLLDEPTNNLDRRSRARFYEAIASWRGTLVVISHDVALLDLMEETAELRDGGLSVYGGGYHAFAEHLTREQDAARQALRTAEQTLRKERRQRREADTKLARRARYARTDYENRRRPKIVMNIRKFQAEVSAGKLRDGLDARVDSAREKVAEQERRVRADDRVRIELPDPGLPVGRRLAELRHHDGAIVLQGPERVALTGPQGIGKTLLLETLFDAGLRQERATHAVPHAVPLADRIGYLPQRLDGLDDAASALENVRSGAPDLPPGEVRARLARFLLRGDDVARPVATLSGGERFRVALARLLLADPPYQLLVLDEPTNNLDLTTTQALVDALGAYRGALLMVSHDDHFLGQLGIGTWLAFDGPERLVRTNPLA